MTNNLGGTRAAAGMSLDAAIAAINDALGEHDAAKTNPGALTIDGTNARTLTAAEMIGNVGFTFTAAGATAACTVNVPALNADGATMRRGFFAAINDTGFDLTVQKSGQSETPPTLGTGQRSILYYDGDNVYVAVPQGVVGGDGADGTDPGILFTWDTGTSDADPGPGVIRADNVSLASATFLYIDDVDRSSNNVEAHLLTWDDSTNTIKGHLYLTRPSDGRQTIFTVGVVTDAAGYVKLAVTYVSGATSFTDEDPVSVQFYRAGNAGAAGGAIAQVVNTQTGAYATATVLIPRDNTIPQNTEGMEVMTLAITPQNASSTLKIEVVVHGAANTANRSMTAALFQDATADALAVGTFWLPAGEGQVHFTHKMTAGTTSETTFKVRAGCSTSEAFHFNGNSGGQTMGGVLASSITITEILP